MAAFIATGALLLAPLPARFTPGVVNDELHQMRIQVREGGVQLDQIVLSPGRYLNGPPGPVQGDTTTVTRQDHS